MNVARSLAEYAPIARDAQQVRARAREEARYLGRLSRTRTRFVACTCTARALRGTLRALRN